MIWGLASPKFLSRLAGWKLRQDLCFLVEEELLILLKTPGSALKAFSRLDEAHPPTLLKISCS